MTRLRYTILLISVTHQGCRSGPLGVGGVYSAPPGGTSVQAVRERVLRSAPPEASGRRLRDAIPLMERRSQITALALREVARRWRLSDDDLLLEFKVLEDDLTRGDEAWLYLKLSGQDGSVLEWYGRARMLASKLDFEWEWAHRHG